MSQLKWQLSALYAAQEAAFLTDPSASGAGYQHLKTLPDMTFTPMMDVVERPGQHNSFNRVAHVMGAKAGTLTFKTELKGSGTPASSAVAAIAAESDVLLQNYFGTVTRGTGSLCVNAGSTTTVVNVTAASGAGFSKYMTAWFDCGATYGVVGRTVTSIAADALTLDRALPAIPTNGTTVWASSKYSRADSGHHSLAFVGQRDSIIYTFLGCKTACKLAGVSGRGTAILEWTVEVTDWNTNAKASLPAVKPLGALALVKAPVIKGSTFAVGGTEELVIALDMDFGEKFTFVVSTAGMGPANPDSVNAGVELTATDIGGSVKAYFTAGHLTDYIAGTEKSLAFASQGGTSAQGWGLYVPKAQWMQPAIANESGLVGHTLPFKVNDNGTDPELILCVA